MKIIKINNLAKNFNKIGKPLIAIWGFFDGWHLGHQVLLKQMKNLARKYHYQTLVISFDVKPQSFFLKQNIPILLNNNDKEQYLIENQIDYYCQLIFNSLVAKSSPQIFIDWLIANNVEAVVTTKDVSFGAEAKGNLVTLQNSSLKVFLVDDVYDENKQKISSSYVKQLLLNKEIDHANTLLSSSYIISGLVVDGIKEGRKLGFPTANLKLAENYVIPACGVYFSLTEVDSKWYQSLTVIMIRNGEPLVESYLLDFDQNIYGEIIKVKFLHYLRDNLAFSNKEDLIMQIKKDLASAIVYFKNAF